MSAQCPNCQNPIQLGAKFCGLCGSPIPQDQQRPISTASEFYQYGQLKFQKSESVRPHQQMRPQELKSILRDIEKGRGKTFEIACQTLKEKRPIEAIEPLWKMKDKIFIKPEVKEAIYEILNEIRSDRLIDLILKENFITDEKMKVMVFTIIASELPPRAVDWLGEQSRFETPYNIVSIEILRRIGTKEAFLSLANNAYANFMEESEDSGLKSKNLLWNIASAGVTALKQDLNRQMAATLLTAPFIPLEILNSFPKIVQKSQEHIYRAQVMAELAQKHGLNLVENLYNQKIVNSVSRFDKSSTESCLAGAALLAGKAPSFINNTIKNIIQSRKITFGDQISASVLTYCLIQYSKDNNSNIYYDSIMAAINDKDKILNQSAIASALYLDYRPVITSSLSRITTNDARFIPALEFCALFHNNPDAKNLFYKLEAQGNNEIKEATNNWRELIMEWKKT